MVLIIYIIDSLRSLALNQAKSFTSTKFQIPVFYKSFPQDEALDQMYEEDDEWWMAVETATSQTEQMYFGQR